ncbi:neutral and basic amino acid transport protein rBAT-like isoform X2 [Homalodisca vitripennis]|uniref:neutral and basic amino acid transport protein rBAT-like isoform X2 n=1 Tax=Homalodisca vitripennis TaxID=197043 RepID=UPI001EEB13F1|nr:neutral and basic amino acid transport protein rBAT-like isoform X2 [Homalodisca vitripennis]
MAIYLHNTSPRNNRKHVDYVTDENGGIKPGLCGITLGVRKNPKDFCFLAWNWPLIRKCCFWGMMSLTVACVCVIIGYITTLPTRCDPPRSWYQGSLIYEIFPASFHDTDDDGQGDLRGISAKVHYLESMGVRGVRLNSIFPSENYPEHYYNVENLTQIEPVLGSFADFRFLVNTLHELNISLILDLPLGSFFKHQEENAKQTNSVGHAHHVIINNHILNSNVNKTVYLTPDLHGAISEVLDFWLSHGVDGFYLKDLENLVGDEKFQQHIRQWKGVLKRHKQGFDKILICSEKVIKILENDQILSTKLATVLTHFDLVDTHIEMSRDVKSQIDAVQGGVMFSRPGYPWPLWTLGSMDTTRLASRLPSANASLAAILVGMMLPGTPSVFYGDEIGLDNLHDTDKQDFRDISHAHHLGMMHWRMNAQRTLHWLPRVQAHMPLDSARWISETAVLRDSSPSIYMHAIWREGNLVPNCAVKYIDKTLIVLERLYPRRHSYVIVANLGSETETRDLSKVFYGGHVVLSTGDHAGKYLTFHKLTMFPGEAMIVKLDK